MKFPKKLISLFLSLFICFSIILPSSVSALSVTQNYYYGFTSSDAKPWIEALENNASWPSQISKDSFYCCLTFDKSQSTPILKRVVLFDQSYSRTASNSSYSYIAPTSYYIQYGSFSISTPSQLSNIPLGQYSQSGPGSAVAVIALDSHYFMTYINSSGEPLLSPPVFDNYASITFPNFDFAFQRNDYSLYGLDLSINDTDFYEWIISNNKLSELPSYITQSKLLSFIQFYSNFGGSFTNFLKNIPDWFSHMNIINQSKDNVNILKSSMDKLYQEYINSFWVEVGKDSAETLPHHRRNIQTQTTDDDTTLITNDQNDSLIESILRDILRGIIQISNQIGDGVKSIIDKLSQLNFTNTIVNNGGNNDTDADVEGINSDISDTMADSIEDVPQLDTEIPNLLSAPAVVGSTVNIYLSVFQSMGLDKIFIFAVTLSFLIIKIRGNTK